MDFINEVNESLEKLIKCNKEFNSNSKKDISSRNEIMAKTLDKLFMLFDGDCNDLINSDNKKYKLIGYMNKGYIKGNMGFEEEALKCFDNALKYCDDDEIRKKIHKNKATISRMV